MFEAPSSGKHALSNAGYYDPARIEAWCLARTLRCYRGRKKGRQNDNSKFQRRKEQTKESPLGQIYIYIYIYSHVLEEQCHQCPMTYMSREDNLCSTPTWNRRRLQKEKGSFSVQAKSPRHTHEHTHFDRVHPVR